MDSANADTANLPPTKDVSTSPSVKDQEGQTSPSAVSGQENSSPVNSPTQSSTGISSWATKLKIPQPFSGSQDDPESENSGKSTFARFTNNLAMRLSPKPAPSDESSTEAAAQSSLIESFAKGLVDSSRNAVKAVQVKARHVVSQNKRRYQEGGFDLDMTYITENIIAMGFPAGDMSSGFFGYVEGLYRNHMEEVIKFFESHHQGKYKVYNLCSERLYDASLFEGKVASFPFDDHNCPPMQLIISFCQSAYSWLKQDLENVVVVHCKAGMARTGLMISSLLLFLKFFPTAEESIDYYNQKRCIDGKGLVLPSQIRYVKYFERVLTYFNGENPSARRCMLRGFRLHRCPYWIRPSITVSDHSGVLFSTKKHPRTKDLNPDDIWFTAPKKGVMVFAMPGEPGLTEVAGDFKIHFHDRQGDFYCWLNTTMTENRKVLNTSDLDGFDKRKLPSPGFLVEVVLVDYNGNVTTSTPETVTNRTDERPSSMSTPVDASTTAPKAEKESGNHDKEDKEDDVFSDGESEDSTSKSRQAKAASEAVTNTNPTTGSESKTSSEMTSLTHATEQISVGPTSATPIPSGSKPKSEDARAVSSVEAPSSESDFKAMAADASVFTFGDEEDYESE